MINTLYPQFQHWSQKGPVYILSDLHFDDPDRSLMDEHWISTREQIKLINKCRGLQNGTFICLGDVGEKKYIEWIKAKYKVLILGNHDARGAYKDVFNEVFSGPLFIAQKILLSHEPITGLPFCLNIHGHDHSGVVHFPDDCKHLNLAANVCGYTPINLGDLIKSGILSDISNIHRITIDNAIERKGKKTQDD